MAYLFPPELTASTRSGGEISIFKKIKNYGQNLNWSVMHSYRVPNHIFKKWGEIDFLFLIPNKGVVCLEVKDHKEIILEGRQWYFGKKKTVGESPFKQINDNQESLLREIKKLRPDLNVPWWSAVIFTKARFQKGYLPKEIQEWEFMDGDAYAESEESFFHFIENVIDKGREVLKRRNPQWITSNDNNPSVYRDLENILSGKCVFSISKRARDGERENSLALATKEQFQIIDLLSQTPRLLVDGLAGTGKTQMAIKTATREADKGKVLFLAYNKNLIKELQSSIPLISDNITVESIDKFFKDNVTNTVDLSLENYWDEILPMQFADSATNNKLNEYYDYLVIDEAQDILSKPYKVYALNKVLRDGLSDGKWSLFGDFNEQLIYDSSIREELFLNLHKYCDQSRYITWTVNKNSRNPIDIGTYAEKYGRIKQHYEGFLRTDEGSVEPLIFAEGNRLQKVKEVIESLLDNEYLPNEIVVLSQYKFDSKFIKSLRNMGIKLKDYADFAFDQDNQNNFVKFSTISSFKGLESPVIILINIESIDKMGPLFYLGITRATEKLVLHITEKAFGDIYDV